ncbi:MAG: hypothetical protein ACRC2R_20665 [Xenococcaceae cyanobacterium]
MRSISILTIILSLFGSISIALSQTTQNAIESSPLEESNNSSASKLTKNKIEQNKSLIPSPKNSRETNLNNLIKLNRAKNFARQAAEQANGGLRIYRAEPSMYEAGEDSPYKINNDGSLTFEFKGRAANESEFTIFSVVTVDIDAQTVTMNYNGPIKKEVQ